MASKARVSQQVSKALDSMKFVRVVTSPRNAEPIHGFILGVGAKWVLIRKIGDGGYLDEGLIAIRLRDIVSAKKYSSFEGRFAQTRPEWPPLAPPDIDLDTTVALIRSMSTLSPLIGIEQERRYDEPMRWIGIVADIARGWLCLHEVRPDASWHERPLWYKLSRITKVAIGDRYLTALAAIADTHPPTAT